MNKTTGFNIDKFKDLSTALLHQIESNVCAHSEHSDDSEDNDKEGETIFRNFNVHTT